MTPLPALPLIVLLAVEPPPEAWELERFPSHAAVTHALDFNAEYIDTMQARQALCRYQHRAYCEAIDEAHELRAVWEELRSAHRWDEEPGRNPRIVRRYLHELRRRIGPAAFAHGVMPAPAPFWRFERID